LEQAGLFSAVTSAFIIDVQSQLQPDTGEETTALLRVLIHKIDNATFGDDTPTIPQWNGPPHTTVQVQALLYTSLAASLLSAFLAMLGKQWLNRYASTDLRGTAIERSQNRQRKLDGIVAWYFDNVMELLPLMLQGALLLLGCALSRYLWEINIIVASVVLGFTTSGVIFYIFILAAGTASESCPYQTPGSNALRYLWPEVQRILHSVALIIASAIVDAFLASEIVRIIKANVRGYHPLSRNNIMPFLKDMVPEIPCGLAVDVYRLGRVITCQLGTFVIGIYHLSSKVIGVYHLSSKRVISLISQLCCSPSTLERGLDQQLTVLDLRCVSWMLQTSLDKAVHLSTLNHLVTITTLADFPLTLVTDCFDAFIGCITVGINNHEVVIMQGLEELATVSALCLFSTISHLLVVNPTSKALEDIHQHYLRIFPTPINFYGHPSYYTVKAAHCLLVQSQEHQSFLWSDYKPSTHEHAVVAYNLLKIAKVKYQRTQKVKVPRFILHFVLHSLSLDPPPMPSIVVNCLLIIAIDLGCDMSDTENTTLGERCVCIS